MSDRLFFYFCGDIMKKISADRCVIIAKGYVSKLARGEKLCNEYRLKIADLCEQYILSKGGKDPYKLQKEFAEKIGSHESAIREFRVLLNHVNATGDKNASPKRAQKIARKSHGGDHREIRVLNKIEDSKDPTTLKVESALEHIKTGERLLKSASFREQEKEIWLLIAKISGVIRDYSLTLLDKK